MASFLSYVMLLVVVVLACTMQTIEGSTWMKTNCSTYAKGAFTGGIKTKEQCKQACQTAEGLARNGEVRFKEGCVLGKNCAAGCPSTAKQCNCYKSKDVFPGICRDSAFCASAVNHPASFTFVAVVTTLVVGMAKYLM